MTRRWIALFAAAALVHTAAAASAQSGSTSKQEEDERVRASVAGSIGFFADDPGGVNLGFEFPIELNRNVSIGPWVTLGLADDFLLLSATANVRYHFDVFEGAKLRKLRPFLQGGVGLTYYDDDDRNDDDTGFLMNMGLGAEYAVSEHVGVGSNIMFNVVPTFRPSEAFYWSWQFVQLRYRF
jgi:outer membrane protein W